MPSIILRSQGSSEPSREPDSCCVRRHISCWGDHGGMVSCSARSQNLGVDLAAECRKYEEKQSGERKELFAAWRMFEIRTFRINSNSIVAGRSINAIEHMIEGARIYIDHVHRDGKIEKPGLGFVLRPAT